MVRRSLGTLVVVVASAFALAPEFLTAQAPPAQRAMIQIVDVKPEGLEDWLTLQQKETIPALKKAGVAERQAWQTATFGEGFQYFFSLPIDNFAAYDNPQGPMVRALGQEGARVYNAKLRKLINATTTLAITLLPESIVPPPTYEPKLMVLNFNYVVPGRGDDFLAYLRNDFMPAIRKAKPVGYGLSRTLHGGDANEFVSARYIEKMADLDGPNFLAQAVGAEAAAKVFAKSAGLVQRQERRIYRFVPNLSFRAK